MTKQHTPTSITTPTRKRGRPSQKEEHEITTIIVETACALFLESGYEATSMKAVSEKANVSPATLYARFPNKAALFSAVVRNQSGEWNVTWRRTRADQNLSLELLLRKRALDIATFIEQTDLSRLSQIIHLEANRFPELAKIFGQDALRMGEAEFTREILESAEGRKLTHSDAEAIARTMIEAVLGWTQTRIFDSPTGHNNKRQAIERIARVIAGIKH